MLPTDVVAYSRRVQHAEAGFVNDVFYESHSHRW